MDSPQFNPFQAWSLPAQRFGKLRDCLPLFQPAYLPPISALVVILHLPCGAASKFRIMQEGFLVHYHSGASGTPWAAVESLRAPSPANAQCDHLYSENSATLTSLLVTFGINAQCWWGVAARPPLQGSCWPCAATFFRSRKESATCSLGKKASCDQQLSCKGLRQQ